MKSLVSGDIIELYLEDIRKYCYLKFIDKRKFFDNVSNPFQFRVGSRLVPDRIISINDIDFSALFLSPWHLMGHKELLKIGRWNVVGSQKLFDYDFIQHHYKMSWPPNLLTIPSEAKQWRVLKNIDNVNEGLIVSYDRCEHLEDSGNHGALNFEFRIRIEQMKIEGRLGDLDKHSWDKYDHILFEQFSAIPAYTKLPAAIQGKLIE